MLAFEGRDAAQGAEARRGAVSLAQAHAFDEEAAGRVAIIATELTTNMLKHAGGGLLLVGGYEDATGAGVECLALDRGGGMSDISFSMRDGHSTAGSPGTGLGAVDRGSQVMDIYSTPSHGTAILARLEPGRPTAARRGVLSDYGAVSVAMAGEEACGDAWCRRQGSDGFTLMVADGLGHGPSAADAAHAAARVFAASRDAEAPSEMLAAMHVALRPTRGAAIGVARVSAGQVVFAGVGNIAATIVDPDAGVRRMVSNNGTVGHVARKLRDFTYPLAAGALLVLASDGVATSWRLEAYPGLSQRHPTLIAGVLLRDFSRGRDDATVLVARIGVT